MLTFRLYASRRGLHNFGHTGFIIVALAIDIAKLDSFLGQSALHKAGLTVDAPHATAIVTEVDYLATDNFFFGHALAILIC
jgi:hypothetical protein